MSNLTSLQKLLFIIFVFFTLPAFSIVPCNQVEITRQVHEGTNSLGSEVTDNNLESGINYFFSLNSSHPLDELGITNSNTNWLVKESSSDTVFSQSQSTSFNFKPDNSLAGEKFIRVKYEYACENAFGEISRSTVESGDLYTISSSTNTPPDDSDEENEEDSTPELIMVTPGSNDFETIKKKKKKRKIKFNFNLRHKPSQDSVNLSCTFSSPLLKKDKVFNEKHPGNITPIIMSFNIPISKKTYKQIRQSEGRQSEFNISANCTVEDQQILEDFTFTVFAAR